MHPTFNAGTLAPERGRLQQGIDQLEMLYESTDHYVAGRSEPPAWVTWLTDFRAGLDHIKRGAVELDGGSA